MNGEQRQGGVISEVLQELQSDRKLAALPHVDRCNILAESAEAIRAGEKQILRANQKDLEEAAQEKIGPALLDRLTLTQERIQGMAASLVKLIDIPDPLKIEAGYHHPKGILIEKRRVPIGLILVVYEARPNVTTDTIGLAVKTGNNVILKGSRQTRHTNEALGEVIQRVLEKHGLLHSVAFFTDLDHAQAAELIGSPRLDLVIPRGGEKLKQTVLELAKAPVLGAGGGVCHAFIASTADLVKASELIFNAKTQRPSVCNALEKVLLHKDHLQPQSLEILFRRLLADGVILRGDERLQAFGGYGELADDDEWHREYLDLTLGVKVIDSLDDAVQHINFYGTGHSDLIITEDPEEAEIFCQLVDSACVYVNVSTRFTDGEEFGLGAEIGISTQKLHARGPIGPHELTTYKYIVKGNGQIRG